MEMLIPAFGEKDFFDYAENSNARFVTIREGSKELFYMYCNLFQDKGFVRKESRCTDVRYFVAYGRDLQGIFVNYYPNTKELTITIEKNCKYFDYADIGITKKTTPQITQLHLEDFGMCYIIRLSDGRFIVIDGGREIIPDAERIMTYLKVGAITEKPIIAAWIISHPHDDHFRCFLPFIERYKNDVIIEKFLMNFPVADESRYFSEIAEKVRIDRYENMLRLAASIKAVGAPVYAPRTGQIYRIGDATLEVLSCMDDTVHYSNHINAISLVMRMELGGQTVLWATDASFEAAKLAERYGTYLKSDILQVPHHGFGMGNAEDTIAGYKLIQPKVCLLPVSDYNAFTTFCTYQKCTNYLMYQSGMQELITGEETRTLELPYEPDKTGERRLRDSYLSGRENAGARTWVFTELNTSKRSDFNFTILNTTHRPAEIYIELFFEEATNKIRFLKTTVLPTRLRKICIVNPEDIESDTVYYNPWSLEKNEIPEDVNFAVRFISNLPVVISHKEHAASYRTSVYY